MTSSKNGKIMTKKNKSIGRSLSCDFCLVQFNFGFSSYEVTMDFLFFIFQFLAVSRKKGRYHSDSHLILYQK
jgi:hypothetical protein